MATRLANHCAMVSGAGIHFQEGNWEYPRMVNVQQSLVLNASARDVWAVVGDFDKLNEWHAAVQSIESEETSEGRMRSLALLGGTKKLVEQLDELDEENLSYSYHIIDGPLPVADFKGTIAVSPHEGDGGSIVSWVASFEPNGTTEEDATAIINGYFSAGLNGLKKQFSEIV